MSQSTAADSDNNRSNIEAIALQQLTDRLNSKLKQLVSPPVQLKLLVLPTQFKSLGLGQWVGIGQSPTSLIHGLRVLAIVTIAIASDSAETTDRAIAKIQTSFLGSDRLELRRQGILNIEVINHHQSSNIPSHLNQTEQSLQFQIVYEALIEKSASEGVIQQIVINNQLNQKADHQ